jgi:hypothetical protein
MRKCNRPAKRDAKGENSLLRDETRRESNGARCEVLVAVTVNMRACLGTLVRQTGINDAQKDVSTSREFLCLTKIT